MSLFRRVSHNTQIMKPFFGLSNRLASILISFVIFGYAIYTILSDGILTSDYFQFIHLRNTVMQSKGGSVSVKYNFESATVSLFGLYEIEIALIKVCVSFLLFIVLLVGATQRSKLLLRIWMMIHALVIILGFLATLILLADSHLNSTGAPTKTLTKFLITLAFSLWFFAIVLSLHEEIEFEEMNAPVLADQPCNMGGNIHGRIIRNCTYVAKNRPMERIAEEKCPPYYDC